VTSCQGSNNKLPTPTAVSTWKFGSIAVESSSEVLARGGSALDAVEIGIKAVELDNHDQYCVGIGGFPNSKGEMEFDAAIMDHKRRYGAVLCLQDIANPISVARSVMEKCVHNVLAGPGALSWALEHGFEAYPGGVLTADMKAEWEAWKAKMSSSSKHEESKGHDTIGLICLDDQGRLAVGTSTSGWRYKHPGRVGDAPLIGSGLYCDGVVGAAVCTGDGEEIMRTCLAFFVVEQMRLGASPQDACARGIARLLTLDEPSGPSGMHSLLTVGVVAMNTKGEAGAASTLDENNQHRGRPAFPVACWQKNNHKVGSHIIFEASKEGAAMRFGGEDSTRPGV